jgi:phenylpyruvate tautomerase PptA (4-oxalocrotonate tautomerase family)
MPLIKIDMIEGRTDDELRTLLDTVHQVVLEAFQVPAGDRYQIVNEHKPSRMIVEDTGLGIARTDKVVFLQITTRPRPLPQKQEFYRRVTEELSAHCGIAPSDVVISLVENTDADWSFGHGRAQFLTGEL